LVESSGEILAGTGGLKRETERLKMSDSEWGAKPKNQGKNRNGGEEVGIRALPDNKGLSFSGKTSERGR